MEQHFTHLPPPHAATRLTVAIPARDEEAFLPGALEALACQRDYNDVPLPAFCFDVIVFANACHDRTSDVARKFKLAYPTLGLNVVEADLPREAAHIGTARRAVMDAAATRFSRAGVMRGIVATTDADSIVDPHWIAATLAETQAADAVTGHIVINQTDLTSLAPPVRTFYLWNLAYQHVVAELEAIRDPVEHDPLPRHGHHFGASFAVTTVAYCQAGGVPPLACMEDIGLYAALHRIDARVRHSIRVRVRTSARTSGRVEGGLATNLIALGATAEAADSPFVELPAYTLARIDARAALRRIWSGTQTPDDLDAVTTTYGISPSHFRRLFSCEDAFGANAQRLEVAGDRFFKNPPTVPLEIALEALRRVRASANHSVSRDIEIRDGLMHRARARSSQSFVCMPSSLFGRSKSGQRGF